MLEFRTDLVLRAALLAILLILGVANANAVGYQQLDPGYGSATAVAVQTIEQEMVDLRAEIRQAARATPHARLQQALDPGPQWVPATAKVLTLEEEMVDLRAEIRGVARAQAASRLQQALDAGPQWNPTSANALAAEVEMFNQLAAFYRAANANAAGQAVSANAEASWSPLTNRR